MPTLIILAYLSLLALGLIDNIRGPFFPEVLSALNLDSTRGSLFFAITSLTAVAGSLITNRLLRKIGSSSLMLIAGGLLGIGFIGVSQSTQLSYLILACVVMGIAFGSLNITQNLVVFESSPPERRRQYFSGLHAMYGMASLLAPMAASLARSVDVSWRSSFAGLSVLPVALAIFGWRFAKRDPHTNETHLNDSSNRAEAQSIAQFGVIFFAVLLSAYLWGEISLSTRLALWVRTENAWSAKQADLLLSGFFLTLLVGRAAFGVFSVRSMDNWRLLLAGAGGSAISVSLALYHSPYWVLPAGLFMAPFYPLLMSQVSTSLGSATSSAMPKIITIGNISLGVMHFVVGFVTDQWGITSALYCGVIAMTLVTVMLLEVNMKIRWSRDLAKRFTPGVRSGYLWPRFLFLLFAYAVCRLFFLFWNWPLFAESPRLEILLSFLYGLRFDASAIAFTMIPLIPFWFLPTKWLEKTWVSRIEMLVYSILVFLSLGVNFVDAELFKFMGKRASYDLFFIRDDVERQSGSMIFTYWYLVLGIAILSSVVIWLSPRFTSKRRSFVREDGPKGFHFWTSRVLLLGVGILVMRGGLQFKPLHPLNAYFSSHHELGVLALNTPFNVIKSRPRGDIYRERYFTNDQEAYNILKGQSGLSRPSMSVAKNWNVVILILESFGLEYMGVVNDYPGYTPFLDELTKKSVFFKHNFANARRSIEGMPSVVCGIPALMPEPIITSDFSNNRFDCLPKILSKHGYSTYFLHGAHNGSMHFDAFSRIAGIEHYLGLNEFPKKNSDDVDPFWGVLDEPMLQFAVEVMDRASKPTFMGIFTLSSHHPYFVPEKYKGKFPKGSLDIHESIGYTDFALRKFFETASTRPWFDKTIFVLTADHASKSDQKKYANQVGGWRVPLIFYVPGLKSQPIFDPDRITQQADILPSVLDLLGITRGESLLVGNSAFDSGRKGVAYNYTSWGYWYIGPRNLVEITRGKDEIKAYAHKQTENFTPISASNPEVKASENHLKAILHYINDGLIHNNLYQWQNHGE